MNEQENKITVSMRKAIAGVDQNVTVGSVYNVTITAVGSLGIFCELDCGVTGLIHLSMVRPLPSVLYGDMFLMIFLSVRLRELL